MSKIAISSEPDDPFLAQFREVAENGYKVWRAKNRIKGKVSTLFIGNVQRAAKKYGWKALSVIKSSKEFSILEYERIE